MKKSDHKILIETKSYLLEAEEIAIKILEKEPFKQMEMIQRIYDVFTGKMEILIEEREKEISTLKSNMSQLQKYSKKWAEA